MNIINDESGIDLIFGVGLLLFTGADAAIGSDAIIEIIAKLGVIGVLWLWLRDLKSQMKVQLEKFDKETDEIRKSYMKIIEEMSEEHKEYKDRFDKMMESKEEENRQLHEKVFNFIDTVVESKLDISREDINNEIKNN